MRLTSRFILLLALAGVLLANTARAAETSVTAILVTASREPGDSDRRLAPYESTLRRILRFESFQYVGQGQATVPEGGEGSLNLGGGQSLTLENNGGNQLAVTWRQGGRTLMRTGLVLRPGVPAVLGGPGTGKGDDVYAVLVTSR